MEGVFTVILCPSCNEVGDSADFHCGQCGIELAQAVTANADLYEVARLQQKIKEFKFIKKQGELAKKEVIQIIQRIRTEYTAYTRERETKVQGWGKIVKAVRFAQTASREAQRRKFAEMLAPHEQRKQEIEASLLDLGEIILQTEAFLLEYKNRL